MIEKLYWIESEAQTAYIVNEKALEHKINELVDAVNTIQKEREAERFEIQEWIAILEAVRKSVNVHEKQIDELQMKLEPEKCEPAENGNCAKIAQGFKNLQDPYAEQCKWIGRLCKFWNEDKTDCEYGILEVIDDEERDNKPYWNDSSNLWFSHCEPVKPDDDIIFKGE